MRSFFARAAKRAHAHAVGFGAAAAASVGAVGALGVAACETASADGEPRSKEGVYVEMRASIFAVNGFYMAMREKYTKPDASIYYYCVEWDAKELSWADFREKVLGATDPAKAADGSARKAILSGWQQLGLSSEPNVGDNGMHASASPFEAMAERLNWLGVPLEEDAFGKALLAAGISELTITQWTKDPLVLYQGKKQSLFDLLEDLDRDECIAKAQDIAGVSGALPDGKMQAFVFIKPHAVTEGVKALAQAKLTAAGIAVTKEGSLPGCVIARDLLVDNHYYAIANKASLSKPAELAPATAKQEEFKRKFGISWEQAVADGVVYNAVDACERLGIDGARMDQVWAQAKKSDNLLKFGGGFYVGKIPAPVAAARDHVVKRKIQRRASGDMSVFTAKEMAIDSVLSPAGGQW